ncbi:MAG TPA: DUF5130 family protein [Actinopolymorphaceae bacterium]
MPAGDLFAGPQRHDIDDAVRAAERLSGLTFSVYVGGAEEEFRAYAERLHSSLPAPATSVLVVVDPAARLLEIVTGAEARRLISDEEARLAALAMQSAFAEGDLAGGIVTGVQQLAEHARRPETLHTTDTEA